MLYVNDPDFQLHVGDALDVLREMSADSVDCVICSPPYWGLRDYGIDGQLGLEETPDEYLTRIVELFREVRRVLAPHGTCWVNLGDSYVSGQGGRQSAIGELPPTSRFDRPDPKSRPDLPNPPSGWAERAVTRRTYPARDSGLKPKDLVGIPWRTALALQADGWYLRADIIWAKPNPMPESVTDRPTKAHEYVFLLTKQPRYWFDMEAVREPHHHDGRLVTKVEGRDGSIQHRNGERWPNGGRNIRSVWTIATQPYPGAHFATYPEELVRRCLLAGCPERVCRTCGKPSERIVETERIVRESGGPSPAHTNLKAYSPTSALVTNALPISMTLGWSDCGHNTWRPGVVLDPFLGSGTTALVARNHGRHCIGIELNPAYAEQTARRLQQLSLLAQEPA